MTSSVSTYTHLPHVVGHHFDDAKQEFDAAKMGMWLFLAQEVLFFSGIFVTYAVFKYIYPESFSEGASYLNWKLGTINTLVLLTSSLTMALSVRCIQQNQKRGCLLFLYATLGMAGVFLLIKAFEYWEKFAHGLLPFGLAQKLGIEFAHGEAKTQMLSLFFGFYYVATGLHALHILIGMGLIIWVMRNTARGEFYSGYFTPVEMVGLYWHLVDIVWIYLFPLLYLVR